MSESNKLNIIETHCHLDYLKTDSIEDTIVNCASEGVDKIITVSVSPDNQNTALEIARKHKNVFCTQGVHPHEAKHYYSEGDKTCEENIIHNLSDPNVVAIGEIGLDYHYNKSPAPIQRSVFERQLQISIDHKLPVIIHTREADLETINILKNFLPQLRYGKLIHCFTAGIEVAEFALKEDFYIGFNGIITFKKADNVRQALDITPMDKIVLETDAPFLAPVPHRGKENSPAYLPFIASKVAEVKTVDLDSLLIQVRKNTLKLFSRI